MLSKSDNFHSKTPSIETHPSIENPKIMVATIRGIDVDEQCDAYTSAELRAIARFLNNLAEDLDYSNTTANTGVLWGS